MDAVTHPEKETEMREKCERGEEKIGEENEALSPSRRNEESLA